VCNLVWWAQELSFKHVLETAKTHSETASKLSTKKCLWVLPSHPCHALPIVQPAFWHVSATVQGTQPAGPMDLASVTAFKSGWHRF
jgi:hypothetical protein